MPRSTYIVQVGSSMKPSKMPSSERYIEPIPGEPTERRVHWANGYDDEANYNPSSGPAPAPSPRSSSSRAYKPAATSATAAPSYAPVEGAAYRGSGSYGASYPPVGYRSGSSFNPVSSSSLLDDGYYFSLSSPSSYHRHPRRRRSIRLTDPVAYSSASSPSYLQQSRSSFMSTPRSSTLPFSNEDLLAAATATDDDDDHSASKQSRHRGSRRPREFEDAIADLRRQLETKDLEIDRSKMESRDQKRRIMELEKAQRELKAQLKEADNSAERYLDRYRELLAKTST